MKSILIFVTSFLVFVGNVLPQKAFTFSISDVKVSKKHLSEDDARKIIEKKIPNLEACSVSEKKLVVQYEKTHPVIHALYHAFANHKPIIISPEIIWLLICQGFSKHVQLNSRKLREKIVKHQGKIALEARRDDFVKGSFNNPWQEVFPEFCKKIKDVAKSDIYDWLVPTFSTTDPIEKAAFELTLMKAVDSYFFYDFRTLCGIPSITNGLDKRFLAGDKVQTKILSIDKEKMLILLSEPQKI